jgi:hypothetical protein
VHRVGAGSSLEVGVGGWDELRASVTHPDVPVGVVDDAVMSATEEGEVVQGGGAAVLPFVRWWAWQCRGGRSQPGKVHPLSRSTTERRIWAGMLRDARPMSSPMVTVTCARSPPSSGVATPSRPRPIQVAKPSPWRCSRGRGRLLWWWGVGWCAVRCARRVGRRLRVRGRRRGVAIRCAATPSSTDSTARRGLSRRAGARRGRCAVRFGI